MSTMSRLPRRAARWRPSHGIVAAVVAMACSGSIAEPVRAQTPPASTTPASAAAEQPARGPLPADLAALIRRLDERVRELETQLADTNRRLADVLSTATPQSAAATATVDAATPVASAPEPSLTPDVASAASATPAAEDGETRLPFSGYMDFHFNKPRDGESELDFHRFVLLFGHSFSDRLKFWSELELEHALVEGLAEKGELELEQAYIDYNLHPRFNLRAGMLLAPVGIINERHEPPAYHGVERPFVDTLIIPSTWFDTGGGIFGDLGRGLTYKAYVMAPLDATGFSAEEGIREGRQKGFLSNVRNVAFTGRLEHHAASGIVFGASLWTGRTGFNLPRLKPRVTVWDVDARWTRGRFDVRGQYAQVGIGDAGNLNAALQRTTGVNPNIARSLRGAYVESGVRLLPSTFAHDLALFVRYENFDTQWRMPDGYLPLQEFDRDAWIAGASYFLDPDVVLKMDYTWVRNRSTVVRAPRSFNLGLGWWF